MSLGAAVRQIGSRRELPLAGEMEAAACRAILPWHPMAVAFAKRRPGVRGPSPGDGGAPDAGLQV